MVELEEEFEKISKKAHEHEQTITFLKKDNYQLKNSVIAVSSREKKIDKSYTYLVDKLRDITKTPIQEVRRVMMKLLEDCERTGEIKVGGENYQDSPLDELNRVREHLEICLKQAVDSGKRN